MAGQPVASAALSAAKMILSALFHYISVHKFDYVFDYVIDDMHIPAGLHRLQLMLSMSICNRFNRNRRYECPPAHLVRFHLYPGFLKTRAPFGPGKMAPTALEF